MTATRTQPFDKIQLTDEAPSQEQIIRMPLCAELGDSQPTSFDMVIMAATAIVVVCIVAVTLGWQIAMILAAGLVAKTAIGRLGHQTRA